MRQISRKWSPLSLWGSRSQSMINKWSLQISFTFKYGRWETQVRITHHIEDRVIGLKVRPDLCSSKSGKVCTRMENELSQKLIQNRHTCYAGFWYEPLFDDHECFYRSIKWKSNRQGHAASVLKLSNPVAVVTPNTILKRSLRPLWHQRHLTKMRHRDLSNCLLFRWDLRSGVKKQCYIDRETIK
jgi:hypothetical protein